MEGVSLYLYIYIIYRYIIYKTLSVYRFGVGANVLPVFIMTRDM